MKGSVGQALRDARLEKKLTVDEVSRATKIRPERISDLENDDYTKFPNIAYARNFLVLYAKFLAVDISRYPTVEVGNTVGLGDYQYLRSEDDGAAPGRRSRVRPEPAGPPEKPRWLIAFFIFLVMLTLGALLGWGYMTLRRLGPVETIPNKGTPAPAVSATPAPAPAASATPAPVPAVVPPAPSPSATPVAIAEPVAPVQPENAEATPASEIRRAEPIAAGTTPVETAVPAEPAESPAAIPTESAEREITIRATKKIKIRVVRDNPQTPSLYLGNINPAMAPRIYKGKHFWIKTTDPDALKITIDGQPVTPGPESGIEIIRTPGL